MNTEIDDLRKVSLLMLKVLGECTMGLHFVMVDDRDVIVIIVSAK